MYQFTSYGDPVASVQDWDVSTFQASDVRHLPLWVAAAREANDQGYCPVYDQIATAVGGPSRADLTEAGLLTRTFTLQVTRRVQVSGYVDQETEVEVEAGNMRDAREQWDRGEVEVEWPSWDHYDVTDLDEESEDVELNRVYVAD